MKTLPLHLLAYLSTIAASSAAITFSASSPDGAIPDGGAAGGFAGTFSPATSSLTLDAVGHNDGITFGEIVGSAAPFSITLNSSVPLVWATQTTTMSGPRAFDFQIPGGLAAGQSVVITASLSSPLSALESALGSTTPLATTLSRFNTGTLVDQSDFEFRIDTAGSFDLTSAAVVNESIGLTAPSTVTANSISGLIDTDLTATESRIQFRDSFADTASAGEITELTYTITNGSGTNDPGTSIYRITFDGNPVPEPSASLLALCSLGLLMRRKR